MSAPPAAVYDAVADLRHRPAWLTEMSDVDAPSGPARAGTRFTATSSILMHRFHGTSCVEVADGTTHLTEEVHIGARFRSTWTVEPAGDGATLRHTIELDLPTGPLGWLLRGVLGWRLRRMSNRSLRLLAARLSRAS